MALRKPIPTGGDYLDLRALTDDGPVLVIVRIREFHEPEKGEFGYLLPVVADVAIVDGPRKDEVHPAEKFIGAITSALRGVRNPNAAKGERPQPPETAVGDEFGLRLSQKNAGKPNAYAVGDVPSATEDAAIEKFYADHGGDALWNVEQGEAPAKEAATARAGSGGGKRPW
jgi:hypothetical protein